jgi:WD40 repeat protein
MTYCLNPDCPKPTSNPIGAKFCQNCGSKLLLQQRYRALKLIGQGGFGRTFLAVDEGESSKPRCVIKQFFPQIGGIANRQKATELFEREAMRLAQLGEHPQIPQLLAHFEQDNRQYLVQEFINGQNLAQVLKAEGAFDEQQIRDLLDSLLPVIEFIHSHNVIHRDIKPENIIRCTPSYQGAYGSQLVLVDFGAAKYTAGTTVVRTGTVIGSAGYAAPEQAGGKAVFSSDLYSLGVTCLHLLTETEPFDLYSFSEATWVWRDYLRRPVSRQLRLVLDKMVEMATSRRFQSASEVLHALNSPLKVRARTPKVIPAKVASQPPQAVPFEVIAPSSNSPILNWRCVYTLKAHARLIRSLAISPDGLILASGSDDATIKLWELATGQKIGTFRGHSKPVCSLAMSADGKILASGSDDRTIKLWQLSTGLQVGNITLGNWFSGNADGVYSIAMSPDGQMLASLSSIGEVKLWNLKTGQEIRRLKGDMSWVQAIAISPDGEVLAGGSGDTIKLWSLRSGRELRTLRGHSSWVRTVAFSPDGQTLASGSDDATIMLWDVRMGRELGTLEGHTRPVYSVTYSPVGISTSTTGSGEQAAFEQTASSATASKAAPFAHQSRKTQELAIAQVLASSSDDRTIKLWDVSTGQELFTLASNTSWVHAIAFSPDGKTLVCASSDNIIYVLRL